MGWERDVLDPLFCANNGMDLFTLAEIARVNPYLGRTKKGKAIVE